MKPMVSVIIPVYNSEKYLEDCLDSVLCQTLADIEILCIDDGSSDGSRKILQQYKKRDNRLEIITYDGNHGPAYARNCGLERAEGKYVYFFDSDDIIVPQALLELVQVAESEKLDIVFFDSDVVYETEEIKKKLQDYVGKRTRIYNQVYSGYDFFKLTNKAGDFDAVLWRMLLSRNFIEENSLRLLVGNICDDNLFSWQAVLLAKRVRCINQSYHVYRLRLNSIMTSQQTVKRFEDFFIVYCEYVRFLSSHPRQEDEMYFLYKYLDAVLQSAKKMYIKVQQVGNDMGNVRFPEPFYEMMYRALILHELGCRRLPLVELQRIVQAAKVIIYGAGEIGKAVLCYLNEYNINKVVFAVTTLTEKPQYVMGNKVHAIDEFAGQTTKNIVLLSVTKRYQREMLEKLDELGFSNVLVMVQESEDKL